MKELSIFDIAGPIMVGPSSSHTAGACKIGQFARAIFHKTPAKVTFYLSGSFGEVYKGHATDRALLAGVMKFRTSDPRIKDSLKIADERKLKYKFIKKDLGPKFHPNTVQIVLENRNRKASIIGSSVGGGLIEIVQVDDYKICLHGQAGKYLSLVATHKKDPNMAEKLKKELKKIGIKTVATEVASFRKKGLTVLSMEGHRIKVHEVQAIEKKYPAIESIYALSKLEK